MSWTDILTAIGLIAVFEGLVLALAPTRLEDLVRAISDMPLATRRAFGLGIVAFGVLVLWLTRG